LTNYLWSSICGEAQRSADLLTKKDIDPSEGG